MPTAPNCVIHLPTQGHPYLIKNKTEEDFNELVGYPAKSGGVERIHKDNYIIHPMFCYENKYWNFAEELRKNNKSTTIVNEEGINEGLCYNMACVGFYDGKPHSPLCGQVFISITKKQYDKVCRKLGYKLNEFNFNEDRYQFDFDEDREDAYEEYLESLENSE